MKLILASLLVLGLIPLAYAQLVPPLDLDLIAHQVFDEVNEERVEAGLQPLTWNDNIAEVAEDHSEDMATRDYLDHYSPEGISPAQRGSNAGFVRCGDSQMITEYESFDSLVSDYKTKVSSFNAKIRQFEKDYQYYVNFGNGDSILYYTIVDKHKKLKSEYDSLKSLRQNLEGKRLSINNAIQDGKIIKGFSENIAL